MLLIAATSPEAAEPPAGFDARIEAVRKGAGVPGMAIAIVEKGRPVLVKGYGVKRLGSDDPVAPSTIFPMGSTGKAVTVAALATRVDQGRIGWDGKVIDHLPGFRMWDPWVLQELGGWKSEARVRRYAHMSTKHLAPYADQLTVSVTAANGEVRQAGLRRKVTKMVMMRAGRGSSSWLT